MNTKGWRFRRFVISMAGAAVCSYASAGMPPATPCHDIRPDIRRETTVGGLRREGARRMIPTHAKLQYAGGMGLMSAGAGWDYGRRCHWETDLFAGFLPKAYSDRTHTVFTLKQSLIPWNIRLNDRFAIEPLSCGIYFTLITGNDYWVREPDSYPSHYYGFTSRLRTHICAGQRLGYRIRKECPLRGVSLYYELSANDLDIIAKCGNKSLDFSDTVYFSVGIRFQLSR